MRILMLVASSVIVLASLMSGGLPQADAAGPRTSLVMYQGGSIEHLLTSTGGTALSVWATVGGDLVGYTVGAPPFVNERFTATFPSGVIPEGQPFIVLTAPGAPPLPSVLGGQATPTATPTPTPTPALTSIEPVIVTKADDIGHNNPYYVSATVLPGVGVAFELRTKSWFSFYSSSTGSNFVWVEFDLDGDGQDDLRVDTGTTSVSISKLGPGLFDSTFVGSAPNEMSLMRWGPVLYSSTFMDTMRFTVPIDHFGGAREATFNVTGLSARSYPDCSGYSLYCSWSDGYYLPEFGDPPVRLRLQ